MCYRSILRNRPRWFRAHGRDELIFENGGIERRIRVFRLPDQNPHCALKIKRAIKLTDHRDNALYVRVTHEDGHYSWSSPVYLFR
jgi:hypothetical protein